MQSCAEGVAQNQCQEKSAAWIAIDNTWNTLASIGQSLSLRACADIVACDPNWIRIQCVRIVQRFTRKNNQHGTQCGEMLVLWHTAISALVAAIPGESIFNLTTLKMMEQNTEEKSQTTVGEAVFTSGRIQTGSRPGSNCFVLTVIKPRRCMGVALRKITRYANEVNPFIALYVDR